MTTHRNNLTFTFQPLVNIFNFKIPFRSKQFLVRFQKDWYSPNVDYKTFLFYNDLILDIKNLTQSDLIIKQMLKKVAHLMFDKLMKNKSTHSLGHIYCFNSFVSKHPQKRTVLRKAERSLIS